jgi:SAM-dependent methyltransferase
MMELGDAEYIRKRLSPRAGDHLYLPLSDLLDALKMLRPPNISRVLDFGCGGSPYRPLFSDCIYHRADLHGGESLDFEFGSDARLPLNVRDYDCVLSTQVLEHVRDPQTYLQECYRVLRPGGHLLLTTHGIFEDHGCPYDYWRWTADGLKCVIEGAGLNVQSAKKLTTGPRCAVFLAERNLARLRFGSAGPYGKLLSLGLRLVQRLGTSRLHKASDVSFPNCRIVDVEEPGHDMYILLAMLARRSE